MRLTIHIFTLGLVIISLFTGCASKEALQSRELRYLLDPNAVSSDTVITLDRVFGMAMGHQYRLWIAGDGTVMYEGCNAVETTGLCKSRVSRQKVILLVEAFRQSGILALGDHYDPNDCKEYRTDAAYITFSIKFSGMRKEVRHYLGCTGFQYEQSFFLLEDLIDQTADSRKWVGEPNNPRH